MTFQSLGLIEALLKAVRLQGYKTPSTIQQKAIPPILEGLDVLASAQTGTGKTAGFTLPMLQILSRYPIDWCGGSTPCRLVSLCLLVRLM